LRPFLEAYCVVADRLAELNQLDAFDEKSFLEQCLVEGQQRVLRRRVASEESVSLEMFRTALRLARHHDLVESADPNLRGRRRGFAAEIRELTHRIAIIGRAESSTGVVPA
jgi:glycerol-3-phosphate O-acyltransferase